MDSQSVTLTKKGRLGLPPNKETAADESIKLAESQKKGDAEGKGVSFA